MANLFDTGGGLPQTTTPFAMDLSAPIMAITQRMVQTRRQEIADDRSEQARNEDLMLKAMDFETVQGLSDKVQEEHIKRLDDFQNQGAEMMVQSKGKLSDADKMKIMRQKRQIDSEIGSMKSNVLAFADLQKQFNEQKVKNPYDSWMDLEATQKAINEWVDAGNIGKSPIGLLKTRQRQPAEVVEGIYGPQLKELKARAEKTIAGLGDNKPAIYSVITDYQKQVDAFKQNVMSTNPAFKNILPGAEHYMDTVYGGQSMEEKFMPGYGRGGKKGGESASDIQAKYEDYNKTMKATLLGDKTALQNLQYKLGADDKTISYDKDGNQIITYFMPDGSTKTLNTIPEDATEEQKRAAMIQYSSIVPPVYLPERKYGSLANDPNIKLDTPVEKQEPSKFAQLKGYLDEPKKKIPDVNKKGEDVKDTERLGWERAMKLIKDDLDPEKFDVTNPWYNKNIVITDKTDPENIKEITFDPTKPDQATKLLEWYKENSETGKGFRKSTNKYGI